jgi:hypothetical protein
MKRTFYCNKIIQTNADLEAVKEHVRMSLISEAMVVGWYWGGKIDWADPITMRVFRFSVRLRMLEWGVDLEAV